MSTKPMQKPRSRYGATDIDVKWSIETTKPNHMIKAAKLKNIASFIVLYTTLRIVTYCRQESVYLCSDDLETASSSLMVDRTSVNL